MKKQFLTIVTLAFGALVLITNCKKKEDSPAPATTTTTGGTTSGTTSGTTTSGTTTTGTTTSGTTTAGTTTSGTTTSGTTTAGTTTSGTTTSGTTTSGTTTSGTTTSGTTTAGTTTSGTTTSGTTTAGTTAGSTTGSAGSTIGGSGTFTVDGASNIPTIMIKTATSGVTSTITQNGNYSLQLMFGGEAFAAGNYSIIDVLTGGLPSGFQVRITVVNVGTSAQYWSSSTTTGTVTVSGKTVTFSNITLKQYNGSATLTVSGNYTFN